MRRLSPAKWILLGVWLGSWLYFSRYAMLDDALIHLRYASFLRQLHFITYDGTHPTYGTSSVLYVSLLALLRGITTSVMLPKAVSVVSYLLLILVLLLLGRRSAPRTPPRLLWLGLLLATLSPMGVRWLSDGMETGTVLLAVVLLAWLVSREEERKSATLGSYLAVALAGVALVLLRIELASLAGLAACVVIAKRLPTSRSWWPPSRLILHGTALLSGAVLALIGLRLMLGSFLPDTALAKSGLPWYTPLGETPNVIVNSLILGIGSLVLTVLSGTIVLRRLIARRATLPEFLAWAFGNASFPLILFLACTRGQGIQGVRYVLWPLFFSTAWNALEWNKLQRPAEAANRSLRWAAWGYAALLLCLLPFDWRFAARSMAGRAETFKIMRGDDLGRFKDVPLTAGDVGFIGYFTGAEACDLNGLVNGREAARLTENERVQRCASTHPQLLFLSEGQVVIMNRAIPLAGWIVCQRVDFTNARKDDHHYLMVPGTAASPSCPAGGILGRAGEVIYDLVRPRPRQKP